jgi:hypothetical protein
VIYFPNNKPDFDSYGWDEKGRPVFYWKYGWFRVLWRSHGS